MGKMKYFYESEHDESVKSLFVVNNGWVNNFMCHNGFSLHCKTTMAEQDSERLIYKLILYNLHACRLSIKYKYSSSSVITIDETSVSNGMVSNATIHWQGAKSACLKTTGHQK